MMENFKQTQKVTESHAEPSCSICSTALNSTYSSLLRPDVPSLYPHTSKPHTSLQVLGVAVGAALTRIYHKADPINGNGCLGNVGGENAFPDARGGHVKYLGESKEVTSGTNSALIDPRDAPTGTSHPYV